MLYFNHRHLFQASRFGTCTVICYSSKRLIYNYFFPFYNAIFYLFNSKIYCAYTGANSLNGGYFSNCKL